MNLPKLIVDKISDYLEPPFVYVMARYYGGSDRIKIYDSKHLTKLVADMFDDAYKYNKTIQRIDCYRFEPYVTFASEKRQKFQRKEDFPYNFFKYKQITVSFYGSKKKDLLGSDLDCFFSCSVSKHNMNNLI